MKPLWQTTYMDKFHRHSFPLQIKPIDLKRTIQEISSDYIHETQPFPYLSPFFNKIYDFIIYYVLDSFMHIMVSKKIMHITLFVTVVTVKWNQSIYTIISYILIF